MRSFFNFLLALPAVLAAPVLLETRQEDNIAGSWIVKVKQNAVLADVLSQVTRAAGVQPTHQYSFGSFKGFSIDSVTDAVSLLSSITAIESIEPNTRVYANAVQNNPPYGLARISHRNKGATTYIYDDTAGAGTFSYIIDTGIYTEHNDFGGRAIKGANFVPDEDDRDGNGHGTHVAGTTGSNTYGVAKKTTLIAVKVLSSEGSGTNAQVLAGIDWAVQDAKAKGRIGKAVANLSLGGIFSPMSNQAAAAAVQQGLFLAIAAGNSGLPTITSSPASEPSVCTVGATDANDNRASFSNYGLLVDIFAPGVNVTSTWIDGPDDTNTISGTSMATPHITGLGAYLLGLEGARTPDALCKRIQDLSTKNKINMGVAILPPSKNYLAYNGNGA
ncbi:hypothetical protein PRZ48_005014 [Zasmidium cellare]|uniref:Peptidase S8/S53 domain-containing protein n=1 Tax=Zasmidium cellare TaxID=395010 RepID=A0ABR0ER88_ZASCE|nr:hypothetical protein PRZ48_005014 [Zasmidium cellare]